MPEKKTKNCIDCGTPISRRATRCSKCANKRTSQSVQWKQKVAEAGKRRRTERKQNVCVNCGKPITKKSTRCHKCASQTEQFKQKLAEFWKKRHTEKKQKVCIDCGSPITRKATRCRKCANRKIGQSIEERRKRSETAKKRCEDPAYRQQLSERAKKQWEEGVFGSPEWSRKVSASVRARWNEDGYREHMVEVLEERWRSQEYRTKVLQGIEEFWTPEQRAAQGERYTGNKNPNWHGGTSFLPYPPAFNGALKAAIRKRDNYTCKMCGALEDGVAHDVHHADYDKSNNDPRNLVTLCHTCHPYTNGNREYWQGHFEELMEKV